MERIASHANPTRTDTKPRLDKERLAFTMKKKKHAHPNEYWQEFSRTGKIGAYLLYRAIEQAKQNRES